MMKEVLSHTLTLWDRASTPGYLGFTNPRNKPLYKGHGFEVIGNIQAGDSSPIFPMLRKPL